MNRRKAKKNINELSAVLYAECMSISYSNPNVSKEDVRNVLCNILMMNNDLVKRLSHIEPGSKKLFFQKLKQDMAETTDNIVEQMRSLL